MPQKPFLSPKVWVFMTQNIKDSSSLRVLKRALENGNPTARVIYAKHFYSMSVSCRLSRLSLPTLRSPPFFVFNLMLRKFLS